MKSVQLTCQEALELITPDIDHRLSESDHHRLHNHLHLCASCRSSWQEESSVKNILQAGCRVHAVPESLNRNLNDWFNNPESPLRRSAENPACTDFRSTITRVVVASSAFLIFALLLFQIFSD